MKVAAYCRVSTDSNDQANSYENQKSFFSHKIEESGHELVQIYADKGITGTKLSRPEFDKMIYDAGVNVLRVTPSVRDGRRQEHIVYEPDAERAPLFEEIWVKNTSRFARNTLSFDILEKLKEKGVYVYFIEQGFSTKDQTSLLGLKMMQVFDEQESRDKSLKIRTGNIETARRGGLRTSSRLYGYRYHHLTNSLDCYLEIIPEEAAVVEEMFQLAAKGVGFRSIAKRLTEENHRTRAGKEFNKTTIRRILNDEKYAGLNPKLKYDGGIVFHKHKPRLKDEYDVEECDRIPPIVSRELFEECRRVMRAKVNYQSNKGINYGRTEYARKIYCGICGAAYVANCKYGRRFYNCSTKVKKGVQVCPSRNVSEERLKKIIEDINTPVTLRSLYAEQVKIARLYLIYEIKTLTRELLPEKNEDYMSARKKENDDLKLQIQNLTDVIAFVRNESQKKQLMSQIAALYEEQARAEELLRSLLNPNIEKVERLKEVRKLYDLLISVRTAPEKITLDDISRIIVLENDETHGIKWTSSEASRSIIDGFYVILKPLPGIQETIGIEWWRPHYTAKGEEARTIYIDEKTEKAMISRADDVIAYWENLQSEG